jgi:hypothetical protein
MIRLVLFPPNTRSVLLVVAAACIERVRITELKILRNALEIITFFRERLIGNWLRKEV